MTHAEILAEVQAKPELIALLPNTQAIANALSIGKYSLRETIIGEGTFMDVIGDQKAADLLDNFDELAKTNNVLRRGLKLLYNTNLDLAKESTRRMLDTLLDPEDAAKLKSLAEYSDSVSEFEVRCALLNNDGTWRV